MASVAVTQSSWAPDALEEVVAPIALYPDQLVGQILAASVNTQEVLDAGNWLLENPDLKGDALDAAAEKAGFGTAMRALVHFPTVVDMMCQELDWTKQLGAAFTSDQKGVLEAIQRLRTSALNVGNLKSGPQQTVETKTENGEQIVEVKPTNPQVVYVPQYDPQVVYTTPPATSTTVIQEDDDDDDAVLGALLGFGVGIAVGAAISNNYCYPSWGYGAVYMGPRPFYPPAYAYRPVYPGYRPAYGYAPHGGYHNNYRNTNVFINNNNNYYNRFDGNSNLKGRTNSPLGNNNRGGDRGGNRAGTNDRARAGTSDRARASTGQSGSQWKGKSNYAGAKPGGSKQVRDAQARAGNKSATQRPAATDRGYGTSDRASSSRPTASASNRAGTSAASSRESRSSSPARVASGTGGTRSSVDSRSGANVIRSSGSTSSSRGDNAFSGASRSGSGSFDRSASARGRASTSSASSARASSGSRGGGGGGGRR